MFTGFRGWRAPALLALTFSAPLVARAQAYEAPAQPALEPLRLDLAEACALAKASSPRVLGARAAVSVAEAASVDAGIFPRTNPLLEVMGGPVLSKADPVPRVSASLTQVVPLGGGVTAREALAAAGTARATFDADAVALHLSRDVALAFVRAQWAAERISVSQEIVTIAGETLRTSELRMQAADISRLELNVARVAVSRANAALASAEAERAARVGELRLLLGVPPERPLELLGTLGDDAVPDLVALLGRTQKRPDLARVTAEIDAAQAEADLADALAAPDLGFGIAYELEGESHAAMGVLSLTLPFFDHGQGLAARAAAELRRAQAENTQLVATIPIEIRAAWEVYDRRRAAARALEDAGAAGYEENLTLARRGYEAGETTLPELLALRREILDAKLEHTDRLLEMREAGILVLTAAGVSP